MNERQLFRLETGGGEEFPGEWGKNGGEFSLSRSIVVKRPGGGRCGNAVSRVTPQPEQDEEEDDE